MNLSELEGLRVQDVIARVSGVSLKSTSRVLRALPLIMRSVPEASLKTDELEALLTASARVGDHPAPLNAHPDQKAIKACHKFHNYMVRELGLARELDDLYNQRNDPYEARAASMVISERNGHDPD